MPSPSRAVLLAAACVVSLSATANAGEWVRVFDCVEATSEFTFHNSVTEISAMAQWPGAKIKFTLPGGDDPDYTVVSKIDSFPLQQLRKSPPQVLSHGGPIDNIGVDSGPHDTSSNWEGTPQAVARMRATCGWASAIEDPQHPRLYWSCNVGGLHLVMETNPATRRCGWNSAVGSGTPDVAMEIWQPSCTVPPSEWLETAFEPVLDIAGSGFTTGAADMFRFSFDYHRKYANPVFRAQSGTGPTLPTPVVVESIPADAGLGECYDNVKIDVAWGDLVPNCHRDDTSDVAFVIYTCKLAATGEETLDPIRGEGLTRIVHNELPVYIKFPKQVTASVGDLSAFREPDVQAAIVRQEVNVAVDTLNVDATVRLFTSVQYPFRLITPEWNTATPTPTGIAPGAAPTMFTDCTPYPQGGDSPGQPGDANACNQVWELDLAVAGGANPATSVCELDGQYQFKWAAECLPTFPSDCPLVQDDQGVLQNEFAITFTLDSEYFCPQVVDTVDVAATLAVYKDLGHTVAATNFILGQTLYVVADVTSTKATVVGVQLDDLSYNNGAGAVNVVVDTTPAVLAPGVAIQDLVIYDSGASVGAATVPANQVWAQFLVSDPPFNAPIDGSQDFSISTTLNVQFKDATAMAMLLQAGASPNSQKIGASVTTGVVADSDSDVSAASGLTTVVGALAAVGALAV